MKTRAAYKCMGLAIMMVLCVGFTDLFSLIYSNNSEKIFVLPVKLQSSGDNTSMSSLIQTGAGYFLKAKSDFSLLLQKVEISDPATINNYEIQSLLKTVRTNLIDAISNFRKLKSLADFTPYDPYMVEKLKRLDYEQLKAKRFHNSETFSEVQKYLLSGDVRGIYAKTLITLEELNKMIDGVYISTSSTAGIFPDLEVLYNMHAIFCESAMFGQYSAEVFYEISK